MNSKYFRAFVLAVLTLVGGAVAPTSAQPLSPSNISFQGLLNGADGKPIADGSYSILFGFYDQATGGTAIGTTNVSIVSVVRGVASTPIPVEAAWFDAQPRFLGISIAGINGGQELSPRLLITSIPYALRASTASVAAVANSATSLPPGTVTTAMLAAKAVTMDQIASGAVGTGQLADNSINASKLAVSPDWGGPLPPVRFGNSQGFQGFGKSVSAVGSDKVVIGAPEFNTSGTTGGAVFVFDLSGSLLKTLRNPNPVSDYSDEFGYSVMGIGSDRILVTAPGVDAAFLFALDGTLLTTITNPAPSRLPPMSDYFGASVALVGNVNLVIGAPLKEPVNGAAYLYDLSGALLETISNPVPNNRYFGISIASLGNDRIAVGGPNGGPYVFDLNGGLVVQITNAEPAPPSGFQNYSASVGTNLLAIGSVQRVPIFNASGQFISNIYNPEPGTYGTFGYPVAAWGQDKIIIGAFNSTSGGGDTLVFSLDGTQLGTLRNPDYIVPVQSIGAVGGDKVVIGTGDGFDASTEEGLLFEFQRYTPGLISDGIRSGSVTASTLAPNSVTRTSLASDVAYGFFARLDIDQTFTGKQTFTGPSTVFTGSIGIGTDTPASTLDVNGMVRMKICKITGGADLAEHFSVTASNPNSEFKVEPGMVVSIDPTGNRKFKLSDEPYDRKRLGIISGGNGVKPGLVLYQEGYPQSDGEQLIALTGQVWCHADASFGAITPGDLLTTSATPGHAMKVTDDAKARFAVLGQALTALREGRGWVLLLVGKQ